MRQMNHDCHTSPRCPTLPCLTDDSELHRQLLEAHAAQDPRRLMALYAQAGANRESRGDTDAACFYLTHAYIYAMELDAPELAALQVRLAAYGRIHLS